MTKLLGYAPVSTADQNLDVQRDALKRAGVSTVFAEKMSGTSRTGRDEVEKVLGPGNTLAIVRHAPKAD